MRICLGLGTGDKAMSFYVNNVCLLLTGPEQFSLTYQTRLGNLDLPAVLTGSSFLYIFLLHKDKIVRRLEFKWCLYI